MIVFNGYLTETAKTHFLKKNTILTQKILLFVFLLIIIPIIHIIKGFRFLLLPNILFIFIVIVFSVALILNNTKNKISNIPKKIYVVDGKIFCLTDRYEEKRNISDVKFVYDFGEFYEIVFLFGKSSEKFICQKKLLSEGTLDEFEAMFEGKIVRQRKSDTEDRDG